MAVRVNSDNPRKLLKMLLSGIDDGVVTTWQVDQSGDLTLSAESWAFKAWFRPKADQERLIFNILGRKHETMSKRTYAVYHARIIELLLTHFDAAFTNAYATADADLHDTIGGSRS